MKHTFLLVSSLLLATAIPSQVGWEPIGPGSTYTGASLLFDTSAGRFLLVDGPGLQIKQWTGSAWQTVTTCPYQLTSIAWDATYDPVRQRVVIVGSQVNGSLVRNILEWDGSQWYRIDPPGFNPSTFYGSVIWDPIRQVVVITHLVTYTWNGVNLVNIAGLPNSPYGLCFNPMSGRPLLPGNQAYELLPNNTWQAMPPCAQTTQPNFSMGLTFHDPVSNTVQAMGNSGWSNQPEVWDGTSWHSVSVGSAGASPTAPYRVALDPSSLQILGSSQNGTWRMVRGPATSMQTFGNGCPGALGIPVISTPGTSGYTPGPVIGKSVLFRVDGILPYPFGLTYWLIGTSAVQWNGIPLPLELSPLGMPGCYLNQSLESFEATTGNLRYLAVPAQSGLLGSHLYVQAMGLELLGASGPGTCFSRSIDATIGLSW